MEEKFFDMMEHKFTCKSNISNQVSLTLKKVNKGVWRMPWLLQAMKDVISCDKLRGTANRC